MYCRTWDFQEIYISNMYPVSNLLFYQKWQALEMYVLLIFYILHLVSADNATRPLWADEGTGDGPEAGDGGDGLLRRRCNPPHRANIQWQVCNVML